MRRADWFGVVSKASSGQPALRMNDQANNTASGAIPAAGSTRTSVLWTLGIEAGGVLASLATFLILAAVFGPAAYGVLGAVLALALIAGPFASFGASPMMMRRVANRASVRADFTTAFTTLCLGTFGATLAITALQPLIFSGISSGAVALLVLGQLPLFWIVELTIHLSLALGQQRVGAIIRLSTAAVRIAALVAFWASGSTSVGGWAVFAAISAAVASAVALFLAARSFGIRPEFERPQKSEFTEGFAFGLSNTAEGFLDASDRPLLVRYDYRPDAGLYNIAYRLIVLSYIPMMALIRARDRQIWQAGSVGVRASLDASRSLIRQTVAASAVVAAAAYVLAPVAIGLLDETWEDATIILRWLSVLPLLKAVQFPLGNILTVSGHPSLRLRLTVLSAIVNLGLNFLWIPQHSWRGAAAATLISEGLLTFLVAGAVVSRTRTERVASGIGPR
ncbi:MAG: O-antigen/teichoic acid export membrane protein [Candidatus Poriferisodalaceae bacterium]|jgi:O-antigen/teichoic acid export membrane protein